MLKVSSFIGKRMVKFKTQCRYLIVMLKKQKQQEENFRTMPKQKNHNFTA